MTRAAIILVLCSLALPAEAHGRTSTFQVGAVVTRSARVRADASRLQVTGRSAVAVTIDSAAPRLVVGEIALPPRTVRVTIQY